MPLPESFRLDPKLSPEETMFELLERRKAFADASSETWIEQPVLHKDNKQNALNEDTALPNATPKTKPADLFEDKEPGEF